MSEQYISELRDPFYVEGMPIRKKCCDTCNYFFPIDRRPHETAEEQWSIGKHRCHSAPGSVCFGSYVGSLPKNERERIVQIEVLRKMNEV
jgi:hypothetical protein